MICVNSVYQGYFLEFHLQASGVGHRCKETCSVCVLFLVDQKAGVFPFQGVGPGAVMFLKLLPGSEHDLGGLMQDSHWL